MPMFLLSFMVSILSVACSADNRGIGNDEMRNLNWSTDFADSRRFFYEPIPKNSLHDYLICENRDRGNTTCREAVG